MTEEEAKAKQCCGPDRCGASHNNHIDQWGHPIRYCVGSSCMAWRWTAYELDNTGEYQPLDNGVCGLAGRP